MMQPINTLSTRILHLGQHLTSRPSTPSIPGIICHNHSSKNINTNIIIPNHPHRFYSTRDSKSSSSLFPIPLSFERFQPQNPSCLNSCPIIILHGLFGSKRNWRSLAKRLSQLSNKTVLTLDLRNHGESNSTPGFTSYLDYAIDVKKFMNQNRLKQVILMGHSMGGKVAMTLALESCNHSLPSTQKDKDINSLIKKLIIIDISPGKEAISESFLPYLNAFNMINSSVISSRKEADEILSQFEKDPSVRQFLLTNLEKVEKITEEKKSSEYKIRLPIEVLKEQIEKNQLGDFPFEINNKDNNEIIPFPNPSLFIKGAKSNYINKYNLPIIHSFFKNLDFITLDTGHWVHAEKPNEFLEAVVNFIKED